MEEKQQPRVPTRSGLTNELALLMRHSICNTDLISVDDDMVKLEDIFYVMHEKEMKASVRQVEVSVGSATRLTA